MVQGDGEVVVIEVPQSLEGDLRLEAGVDEDEGDAGPLDDVIDLGHGVAGGEAGPGHAVLRDQHVHHRGRAAGAADDAHGCAAGLGRAQPVRQGLRVRHGGRQPHLAEPRAERLKAGQAKA